MTEPDQEPVNGQPGWIAQRLELFCCLFKSHNWKIHATPSSVNDISSIIEYLRYFNAVVDFYRIRHLL